MTLAIKGSPLRCEPIVEVFWPNHGSPGWARAVPTHPKAPGGLRWFHLVPSINTPGEGNSLTFFPFSEDYSSIFGSGAHILSQIPWLWSPRRQGIPVVVSPPDRSPPSPTAPESSPGPGA
ncbi:unnamed protein product [Gadus morhua 'NCC']